MASEATDIGDVKHIIDNKKSAEDMMDEMVNKWDAQKDEFYEKTGITRPDQIVAANEYFHKELENFVEE